MKNENSNGKSFILEFFSNFWKIILIVLVGVIILGYVGFFVPTLNDDYRGRLSYDSYSIEPGRGSTAIMPGDTVEAILYIRNIGNKTIFPFSLELEKISEQVEFPSKRNMCRFDSIPPGQTRPTKEPIEFALKKEYNYPYVLFFGKLTEVMKAGYVVEILTNVPKDAISIVMPVVVSSSLNSNYWVGVSACSLYVRANATADDTLIIALNLFNETGEQRDDIWLKINRAMIGKSAITLGGGAERIFGPVDRDSVRFGQVAANGFKRPNRMAEKFKFHVKVSPINSGETVFTYFDVMVGDSRPAVSKSISFGAEAIVRRR